jgi:hypothetical protein
MRSLWCLLAFLAVGPASPAGPPADRSANGPAKIRVAGVFIAGFNVWKMTMPNCSASGDPWLKFECGFFKCPKPKSLGIPLELDYTNWRQSPRVTEVELPPDQPVHLHFQGNFARGMGDKVRVSLCSFDVNFTPRAGAMYEATMDPTEDAMFGDRPEVPGGRCKLKLSEIRLGESAVHERVPVDGADVVNCLR